MRQLLRRFFTLGSTSLFTQLIGFVALAIVARRVGPSELGSYTVGASIVAFIGLPISLGMTAVGTRDVAQAPERVREIAGEVFVAQMLLATGGYVVILVLAPFLSATSSMGRLLPIVGLLLLTGTSFEWTLQALGSMRSIAFARIVSQVIYGALVPVLVVPGYHGIVRYAWLMVGGLALKHAFTTVALIRVAGPPRLRLGASGLRSRLRASVAMGYASVMLQIYGTIDQVMLGYLSTAYDAGQYAAASRIPGAIGTFAGSWLAVVFPHSAALARTDRQRLRRDAGRVLTLTAMFALPLAACSPFVARGLMVAAFGRQFGAAALVFSLFQVAIALSIVDTILSSLIFALDRERVYVRTITVTALLNVVLNFIAIPLFGRDGAAVNTIICETFLLVMLGLAARRLFGSLPMEWDRLGRTCLAVLPAVAFLILVRGDDANVWVRIVVGATVYLIGTLAFGAVRISELRQVLARDTPLRAPGSSAAGGAHRAEAQIPLSRAKIKHARSAGSRTGSASPASPPRAGASQLGPPDTRAPRA